MERMLALDVHELHLDFWIIGKFLKFWPPGLRRRVSTSGSAALHVISIWGVNERYEDTPPAAGRQQQKN